MSESKQRVLIVGHSHAATLRGAWPRLHARFPRCETTLLNLRSDEYRLDGHMDAAALDAVDRAAVRARLERLRDTTSVTALTLRGGSFTSYAFAGAPDGDRERGLADLERTERHALDAWFRFLRPLLGGRVVVVPPPPPVASVDDILGAEGQNPHDDRVRTNLSDLAYRRALWERTRDVTAALARAHGWESLDLPASIFDADGFLASDCRAPDMTHGNGRFGERVLADLLERAMPPVGGQQRARHPYVQLPDHRFWRQAVSDVDPASLDPVIDPPFVIGRTQRVATAGSCFAQHISRRLRSAECNFFAVEEPSAEGGVEPDFSARFGNVYTARQLRQLFERAMWTYRPHGDVWRRADGRYCDAFRPRIEPAGYATEQAVREARVPHLQAVNRMFRELDVLVFTLGLTEAWTHRADGAVYPLAPGVAGGQYDPARHAFVNFSVREMVDDLNAFYRGLKHLNPKARMILTVSPQPIVATAEREHVLVASTYTKAALRVAADEFASEHDDVYYFPSYEIITGNHAAGAYFRHDRRSVTDEGVDHVMRVFMARMVEGGDAPNRATAAGATYEGPVDPLRARAQQLADAACDEEALAR